MSGLQINVGLIGVTRAAACGEWDKVSHRLPILPIPNSESPILNVRCTVFFFAVSKCAMVRLNQASVLYNMQ